MSLLLEYSPTLQTESAIAIGKDIDGGVETISKKRELLDSLTAKDLLGNKKAQIEPGYDITLDDPTLQKLKYISGEGDEKKSIFGSVIKYRKAIYY